MKHLKKYQSTKVVGALKIHSITRKGRTSGDGVLTFEDEEGNVILDESNKDEKGKASPLEVLVRATNLKRPPVKGDYYVVDDDKNISFLSPDAFDSEFSLVTLPDEEE